MRALLAEWQREWDALSWHEKLRRRVTSLPAELFGKAPAYDDETLARFPSLAEGMREWDALPEREQWRERFNSKLAMDLAMSTYFVLVAVAFAVLLLLRIFRGPSQALGDAFVWVVFGPFVVAFVVWVFSRWVLFPLLLLFRRLTKATE
jgi:hypothetical protein